MKDPMHIPAIAVALVAALLTSVAIFRAHAATPAKPMVLQGVMQQLERDMQAITGAISREDWPQVAELAPKIASHPAPPLSEKLRILAWLGTNAGQFRGFDGQVHDAAVAMGEAAAHGNGQAVIAGFAKVQQGCLGCHEGFRKSFVEHFHDERLSPTSARAKAGCICAWCSTCSATRSSAGRWIPPTTATSCCAQC